MSPVTRRDSRVRRGEFPGFSPTADHQAQVDHAMALALKRAGGLEARRCHAAALWSRPTGPHPLPGLRRPRAVTGAGFGLAVRRR